MLNLVCITLESAHDQHRANQHCPDRGQGLYSLIGRSEENENSSYKL
ncbi:unnamed protein product [Staurois parvus]|uniref:Uncharacterized protein n=1 Tax=Staurois parvus TaxID=386267 RepID=A0ABN9FBW0_9NEOB|nr:unnamed protein product [Staurois parvus]